MRVTFRQSGGFTGLTEGCTLDTDRLPSREAARLRSLVKRGRLAKAARGRTGQARDLCCYEITIHTENGVHRLSFDEMSLPKGLGPLVTYLRKRVAP